MEQSKKQRNKTNIEIDTVEFGVLAPHYKVSPDTERYGNTLGLIYRINEDNIYFKASAKLFAKPNDIGAITLANCHELSHIIESISGIQVDEDYLLNKAVVYSAHVKKDIHTKDSVTDYISLLREALKSCTDKFDIYRYSDLTYENGFSVIPKPNIRTNLSGLAIQTKTLDNYRYVTYSKGPELNKFENKNFRKIFDYDYLQYLNQVIRFEYQMRKFDDMREAFNIDEPTLNNILNSDTNPVYDFLMKLLHEIDKEDNNDIW